jgi:hypothetical protein
MSYLDRDRECFDEDNQHYATQYTVKKVSVFLVPSRDVTNQTIPGRDNYIVPRLGEFGS